MHHIVARRAGTAMEVTCDCGAYCTITEDLRIREDVLNGFLWQHKMTDEAAFEVELGESP